MAFWFIVVASLAVCLLAFLLHYRSRRPPLPAGVKEPPTVAAGLPLVGTMIEFSSRPHELLARAHQEHGEAFTLDLLVAKINVFSGREAHKQFFEATDEVLNFHKAIAVVAQAVLGKDVFLDPEWQRKSPYFVGQGFSRPEKLNAYGPIIRDEATKHIRKWLQASGDDDKGGVNLYEALSHLVTCVHIRIILGDAAYEKHADEIARTYFQLESNAVNTFAMMFPNFPSPAKLRNDRARRRLVEIIDGILQASIQADADQKKKKTQKKDGPEDDDDDDEEDNNEIGYVGMVYKQDRAKHPVMVYVVHGLALMFGAHTNTAGTLFWVAAELARSRALRDKARAEQEAVLENLRDPTKTTQEDEDVLVSTKYLAKLDYLDACMKESVRKYSTLLLVRLAMRDTDFVGSDGQRYFIREGDTVAYSPYLSHYDEKVYPNPSQFDPERYTDRDRRQALLNDRHFIQFGAGVHRCPGEKFANLVIKGALSLVLRSCEFEVVGDFQEPDYHKQAGTPNPVAPIWVKFRPRATTTTQ